MCATFRGKQPRPFVFTRFNVPQQFVGDLAVCFVRRRRARLGAWRRLESVDPCFLSVLFLVCGLVAMESRRLLACRVTLIESGLDAFFLDVFCAA